MAASRISNVRNYFFTMFIGGASAQRVVEEYDFFIDHSGAFAESCGTGMVAVKKTKPSTFDWSEVSPSKNLSAEERKERYGHKFVVFWVVFAALMAAFVRLV